MAADPLDNKALRQVSRALLRLGRPEEAVAPARQAWEEAGAHVFRGGAAELIEALAACGRRDEALLVIGTCLANDIGEPPPQLIELRRRVLAGQ